MKPRLSCIAKIRRPGIGEVFPRQRLFRILDDLWTQPVIWIAGPAGSGKTTLMGSYLDARSLPCLWYRLDETDSDIAGFFYYLGLARKAIPGGKRSALPLFTPEYAPGVSVFTRRFFEAFYAGLTPPFAVVLDDCHQVGEAFGFHDVLRHGLSLVPDGIHVIVLSRGNPPPSLMGLFASRTAVGMGWDDLKLTRDETRGIARIHLSAERDAEMYQQLHRNTQGWVAGLILMLTYMRVNAHDDTFVNTPVPRQVFDYFAGEVFDRMELQTRGFLLKTALLPKMTPSLCRRLTGVRDSGRILSELSHRNCFTEKLPAGAETVFRYHDLFRKFLLSRLEETFSEEEVRRLKRDAADLLERSGDIEDAVRLHAEAGIRHRIQALVIERGPELLAQGRLETLKGWIDLIPQDLPERSPWLLYWLGTCRLPVDPSSARVCFTEGLQAFQADEDQPGFWLAWCAIVESLFLEWEDLAPLDHWIGVFEKACAPDSSFPTREVEERAVAGIILALLCRQMDKSKLSPWIQRAVELLRRGGDSPSLQLGLMAPLLHYYNWMGDYADMEGLIEVFRARASLSGGAAPLWRLFGLVMQSFYEWSIGRFEHCLEVVAEGLRIAEATGVGCYNIMFYGQGAHASLNTGDLRGAGKYLASMRSDPGMGRRLDVSLYHFDMAWQALLKGDLPRSLRHVEISLELALRAGSPWPIAVNHVSMAEVLFEFGETERAFDHLNKARAVMDPIQSDCLEFKWLTVRSYFAYRTGNRKEGEKYLRPALKLGREKGFVSTTWWCPQAMTLLCGRALEAGIEVDYVRRLITKRGLLPESHRTIWGQWPYPVKIFTLGRFEILKNDVPLVFSRKAPQKPLSLLKSLIAMGGVNVPGDRLMDELWPDSQGDLACMTFDTTLHRLRRLLGCDAAVSLRNRQVGLDARYCWIDVWAFEEVHKRIAALKVAASPEDSSESNEKSLEAHAAQREHLAWQGVALYGGPFLQADIPSSRMLHMRERLQAGYIRLLRILGECCEERSEWETAAEWYRKGLEADDLDEECTRSLMICSDRLGRVAEVFAVYNRCCRALSDRLGAGPSSKTETLFCALTKRHTPIAD